MSVCECRIVFVSDSNVMLVKTVVSCGSMLVTNSLFIVLRFIWVSGL